MVCGRYFKIGEVQRARSSFTIWFCAHKSSLAWKAASNEIPEIKNMLMTLNGIVSYFAKS